MAHSEAAARCVNGWPLAPGHFVPLPDGTRTLVREVPGPRGAPTVVLLHGLGATSALMWFATMTILGRAFRVLAPDLRGHGRGARCRRFTLGAAADDIPAVLDDAGVERAVLLGYSMGGAVAQVTARRHPERVAAMVLAATACCFPAGPMAPLATALGRVATVPLRVPWWNPLEGEGDDTECGDLAWATSELRGCHPRALLGAGMSLAAFRSCRWLGDLAMPAAVVVTERDRAVPAQRQHRMARRLRHGAVFGVDAGHLACGRAPEQFGAVALRACRHVVEHVEYGAGASRAASA